MGMSEVVMLDMKLVLEVLLLSLDPFNGLFSKKNLGKPVWI